MQKFDIDIQDRCRIENVVTDHFSRIPMDSSTPILDSFPDECILEIRSQTLPWYAHIVNYRKKSSDKDDSG